MGLPESGWHHYAPLVIQGAQVTGGPHSNVPVYLDETCLPSDMLDADGEFPCKVDGRDIRFSSDLAGQTELPFHIVEITLNANPANATANIWVRVPSLQNGVDTTIYIWWYNLTATAYGKSDTYGQYATWPYDVKYMFEGNGENVASGSYDLEVSGPTFVSAKIDDGIEFDGDPADYAINSYFSNYYEITVNFWLYVDSGFAGGETVFHIRPYKVYVDNPNANKFRFFFECERVTTDGIWRIDTEYDVDTWYHIQITYNNENVANNPEFTINGAVVGETETQAPVGDAAASGSTFYLGADPGNDFVGIIDEFFLSWLALSSDLGATMYANMNAPAAFTIEGAPGTIVHVLLPGMDDYRAYQEVDPLLARSVRAFQDILRSSKNADRAFQSPKYLVERDVLVKSGYKLVAKDTTSGEETELGFIAYDASPLTLAGITLTDGTYDILIYLQGYLWHDARLIDRLRVTVLAGAISVLLPPQVEELAATQRGDYTRFLWTWSQTFGALTPDNFGVWISTTAPPATVGVPDYLIEAETPRNYDATHEQGSVDTIWVAVAAITGTTLGPESRLGPLAPAGAASSPTTQQADDDELLE